MKKLIPFILFIALVSSGFLTHLPADSLQPIPFPFIGKWNPSESPELLDDFGLQDVQNVRKIGKHFKGIGGHSIINSTSIATYHYFLNGFHFYKDQPQESHVIILATSTTDFPPQNSYLFQNTTAIPGTGNFSATTLQTDPIYGTGTGRFSMAPAGNMVYCNGAETLIWGGNEIEPVSFISAATYLSSYASVLTNPKDYTEQVRNSTNSSTSRASISSTYPVWFMGFYRPLQGAKLYIATANTSASTITVDEWNGSNWAVLATTDNTKSGGIALAQTGTITWPSTKDTSKLRYISGLSLYWYQFTLSAGSASVYYATVDAPMQSIKNIWDGVKVKPSKLLRYIPGASSVYQDFTDDVIDELNTTYLDLSSASNTEAIYIGFTSPQQAIEFILKPESENTNASTMNQFAWSGSAWVGAPTTFTDGTKNGSVTLNKSGVISWPNPTNAEFTKTISDEVPLYYYSISFSSILDGDVKIAEIRGIPRPKPLSNYSFSETFQNRLFLFDEKNGERNKAIYSGANTPDIFNGADSGQLYFGDKNKLVAAKTLYNVFRTFAAEQLIITKTNETWRVSGNGPENWENYRISSNIGCVAPLSMAACEVSDGAEEGIKRQVVIWQSDKGFVITDGAAIIPISNDIRCYFDPNDSRYIPTTRQARTVAWFDPYTRSYKALISSGSTATYHNIELEYSLEHKEWTKIYRADASGADPLQCGFQVFSTDGTGYTYGGNTKGFMYRLEHGATFAGTNITNKIQTKDLILDAQVPLFRKSTVKFLRTAHKKKTGTVTVAHYGDQVLTVDGTSNQAVPDAFSTASTPYNTQSTALGPFLFHSFLFTSVTSTSDGMELSGLAIYSEPYTAMR